MMMLLALTFELCRHASKVVLRQEFWQSSPPVYWVGNSCTFLSSTAHTNLFTVQNNKHGQLSSVKWYFAILVMFLHSSYTVVQLFLFG